MEHRRAPSYTRLLWKRALAILAAAAFSLSSVAPASSATPEDDPFTVYVSTTGKDSNSGLTSEDSVATLVAAQGVLQDRKPQTDVEIRISPGTYLAPTTRWTYYVPDHTVSFMPIDYQIGDRLGDIEDRPVFRGVGAEGGGLGFWMNAGLPEGDEGGDTGYRFYYLEVQRYERGGLLLGGGAAPDGQNIMRPSNSGANGNTVRGMVFREIGTTWVQGDSATGYDGVGLSNSSNNVIEYNQFVNLENFDDDYTGSTSTGGNHMHGIYLTNHSSDNVVRFNQFDTISGDPLKVKNDSNNNEFSENTARDSGTVAFIHDWFCDFSTNCANKQAQECASHGNSVHSNRILSSYGRGEIADSAMLIPGDDYAGGAGCDNAGESRFIVGSNVNETSSNAAPLRVNERELPPASVGVPYKFEVGLRGGVAPYTWSATGLPGGVSIDSATGALSGTPTLTGNGAIPIRFLVEDAEGSRATISLQMLVTAAPTIVDTRSTAFGVWPDGRAVAYIVSHSGPLTLSAVDAETGELVHAEVLVSEPGTKSYSASVGRTGEVYVTTDRAGLFVFVPSSGEVQHSASIAGDPSIAMVDAAAEAYGVTSTGNLFSYDHTKPEGDRAFDLGRFTAQSPSGSAIAVGDGRVYVGTYRGGARLFEVDLLTGASDQIPLPASAAGDAKIQDLAYRDGKLFVFSSASRDLLTFNTQSKTWGASMPLMGGSRISSVHEGSVFLVSDETKRIVSFDLGTGEFIQSAMAANSISYSRAYGIGVIDSGLPSPYSGPTVVGVAANADLWQFNLSSSAFRFLPGRAQSGPDVVAPLRVVPSWTRFDAHVIPVGSELSPGVIGEPYQSELQAAGGKAPYVWELVEAEHADEVALSPDGRLTSTRAAAGRSHVMVRVTDSVGNRAEANMIVNKGGAVLGELEIPIVNLGLPKVSGDPVVGSALRASPGEWDYQRADYEVQWYRDGQVIEGANDFEYIVTRDDVDAELRVAVTAGVPGTEISAVAWSSSITGVKGSAMLVVNVQTIRVGESLVVTGSGFDPNLALNLELRSDPVTLGEVTTDAEGMLSTTVVIPAGVDPGPHTLVAVGADEDLASAALTVLGLAGSGSADGDGLATTGADSRAVLGMLGLLLVAGSLLVIIRRRKAAVGEE